MNERATGQRRHGRFWALCLTVLMITGCATHRIDWDARVGQYTYDQAVIELGPPDKEATLQDGTKVAEWLTRRGNTYAHPAYLADPYPYWYAAPVPPVYVNGPDYLIRLQFAPDGSLRSWKRIVR